jgi:hypothetical protein
MVIIDSCTGTSCYSGFPKPLRRLEESWCDSASLSAPTSSCRSIGIDSYVTSAKLNTWYCFYVLNTNGNFQIAATYGCTITSHFMYLTSE